jgi:hypothetical protein
MLFELFARRSGTPEATKFTRVFCDEMGDIRVRRNEAKDSTAANVARANARTVWAARFSAAHFLILENQGPHLTALQRAAAPASLDQLKVKLDGVIDIYFAQVENKLAGDEKKEFLERYKPPLFKALRLALQEACQGPEPVFKWDAIFRAAEESVLDEADAQLARLEALRMDLVGVAFSGGGIRSATFNLGVLQALARFNLLRHVDYLSTVSGGGYIGGWLAAWVKRAGSVEQVEGQLNPNHVEQAKGRLAAPFFPGDVEPEPIFHLRRYSSYLRPNRCLFSSDTWSLVAGCLRNVFLNLMVLLPLVLGAILLVRPLLAYYMLFDTELDLFVLGGAFFILTFAMVFIGIFINRLGASERLQRHGKHGVAMPPMNRQASVPALRWFVLLPLVLFGLLLTWQCYDYNYNYKIGMMPAWEQKLEIPGLRQVAELLRSFDLSPEKKTHPGWGTHAAWIVVLGAWVGAFSGFAFFVTGGVFIVRMRRESQWRQWGVAIRRTVLAALAGFLAIAIYYVIFGIVLYDCYREEWSVAFVAATGTPLTLASFVVGAFTLVGLFAKNMTEAVREWWASLCGWLLIYAVIWASSVGVALFGPPLVSWATDNLTAWLPAILGSGWVASAVAGVTAGYSAKTNGGKQNSALEWVAILAPNVFITGLLVALSWVAAWVLTIFVPGQKLGSFDDYFKMLNRTPFFPTVPIGLGFIGLGFLMAFRVDVNVFSFNAIYANRLVRCYLGASRRKDRSPGARDLAGGAPVHVVGPVRSPDPITGFDLNDDAALHRFRIGTAMAGKHQDEQTYFGPMLLINTAMNLLGGDELAWQERKAESFLLSPLYCGSETTGYRPWDGDEHESLSLGSAMAISGAAVSPNMGYHSSPAMTALLTIFNFRLGAWVNNPKYGTVRGTGPKVGLLYLLKELFGRTNDRSNFIYASDGGHFENLGVYELVRRRCRLIVACDAGADPEYKFEDLANLVRKCRIDLGISIQIDAALLKPGKDSPTSQRHCAIGVIRYKEVDPEAPDGILLYIKSTLTGDEPEDVRGYQALHPEFPHTTTADQDFNESKFESYRQLGYHIAQHALHPAMATMIAPEQKGREELVAALTKGLNSAWGKPRPGPGQI